MKYLEETVRQAHFRTQKNGEKTFIAKTVIKPREEMNKNELYCFYKDNFDVEQEDPILSD